MDAPQLADTIADLLEGELFLTKIEDSAEDEDWKEIHVQVEGGTWFSIRVKEMDAESLGMEG